MSIKKFISAATGLCIFLGATIVYASDSFQQWMQQQSAGVTAQQKEFQVYKDKRDKEFSAFLKAQWQVVDLLKGNLRDDVPKPDVMPVASPQPVVLKPVARPAVIQPAVIQPVIVTVAEPELTKKPLAPTPSLSFQGKPINIDFYGKQIRFYYDPSLQHRLTSNINKEAISDYWSALSHSDYDTLLKQLAIQKKSLQLNDWAYALLVNKLAVKINNNRKHESVLLSWYLLTKSDYQARIAYNKANIFLLLTSAHEMFEVSYFIFAGKRYYAVTFDGIRHKPGQVYTYNGEYPGATKALDMRVTAVVASSDQPEHRHLSFNFEATQYNIKVNYDRGRIAFFRTYPQLNLNLYFSSDVYEVTATPLQKQLAGYMQGMSEQQAVNFLLRFVQTSLKYETDNQQFGKENYLFPEETLFYPYSDCEDRAVLFSWLVKSLLNLDVVGLEYPGHVAAAVHFTEDVAGDSVSYNGKRYIVTDPTYINANVGMTMPDFKQYKPAVIVY